MNFTELSFLVSFCREFHHYLSVSTQPSPDSSGNPEGLKANFSSLFGATNGSHEKVVEK